MKNVKTLISQTEAAFGDVSGLGRDFILLDLLPIMCLLYVWLLYGPHCYFSTLEMLIQTINL